MTNALIKKKVDAEIEVSSGIGDIGIYKFVMEIDPDRADEFMLSEHGGYTRGELNQIKNYIKRNKRKYNNESKALFGA